MKEEKIILDLCGGTGSWSKPYKAAGYDVRVITMPDYDVRDWRNYKEIIQPVTIGLVYGILAAPPCTEFSLAKSTKKRDFVIGMEVVRACLEIIWESRLSGGLRFWALENPRAFLRQFLGKPAYTFEHWEFGDDGIKPTDLWGYFEMPKRTVRVRPAGLSQRFPNGRWNAKGWSKSAEKRGITPQNFANAFFRVNP